MLDFRKGGRDLTSALLSSIRQRCEHALHADITINSDECLIKLPVADLFEGEAGGGTGANPPELLWVPNT